MAEEKRLGRGLASLLGRSQMDQEEIAPGETIAEVEVDRVQQNPLQPRKVMAEDDLAELTESIRTRGLLQPIVVRRTEAGYELIAGQRRLAASKRAGLRTIPVVLREASDEDMLSLALIENLQRSDLNPIEKARAFAELMARFKLTQEEAAKRVGKERSTLANFVRLLELPDEIQEFVSRGTISMGHARALLALPTRAAQMRICERVIRDGLSVREVEKAVKDDAVRLAPKRRPEKPVHLRDIENRLRERLSAKVQILAGIKGGRVVVHYADGDDLERLLDRLEA